MGLAEEVAVFAETNLDTGIVMTVPLDTTVGDFKRKLQETHIGCFPSLGEIRVHGVMVKRKSRFYYLAESVPMKFIFRDNQKPWFIHAEARLVAGSQEPSISNSIDKSETRHCSASENSVEGVSGLIKGRKKKIKKSPIKSVPKQTLASHDKRGFLGPPTPDPESIITSPLSVPRAGEMKIFKCFNGFRPKTPERKPGEAVSKSDTISKKLTVAANNIRMQGKSHVSSSLSSIIFRTKTGRERSLDCKKITSLAKFLVFEVPNNED